MHPRQRRLLVGASVVLLAIVVISPWIHRVAARPAIADFAPTYSAAEAAARVAAAQNRETLQRHDALQRTTTSGELPLVPEITNQKSQILHVSAAFHGACHGHFVRIL